VLDHHHETAVSAAHRLKKRPQRFGLRLRHPSSARRAKAKTARGANARQLDDYGRVPVDRSTVRAAGENATNPTDRSPRRPFRHADFGIGETGRRNAATQTAPGWTKCRSSATENGFGDGEWERAEILERPSNPAHRPLVRKGSQLNVLAVERRALLSGVRNHTPRRQRGLAGTVVTDEPEPPSRHDSRFDPVDRGDPAEPLTNP